jgi:hypothetical protein
MLRRSLLWAVPLLGITAYARLSSAVSDIRFVTIYSETYAKSPGVTCSGTNTDWRCNTFVGAASSARNFHNEMSAVGNNAIGGPYEV